MKKRYLSGPVIGLILLLSLAVLYLNFPGIKNLGIVGAVLLPVSYFTGLLAIAVSALFTVFSILKALPVISYLYGSLILALHKIHYTLFSVAAKKILGRNRRYREFEAKVKHSRIYRGLRRLLHRITRKAGLVHPHKLKVFEVKDCLRCGKEIPLDSRACPYCIARQKRRG